MTTNPADIPKRWPLVVEPHNRNSSTLRDARLVNCYMEKQPDGSYAVIKRPGFSSTYYSVTAAAGKGLWAWPVDGKTYAVFGGNLYRGDVTSHSLVGAVDNTAGKPYFFNTILGLTPSLVLGNGVASYGYNAGAGLFAMSGTRPPSDYLRGFVYLDGTLYDMDASARIFGSGINDVTTWDPSNIILSQSEADLGVALAKQNAYVVAFNQWSTEFFYDAGNPTGSPLADNPGAKLNYGCTHGDTLCDVDGHLLWVGQTKAGTPQVYLLDNLNFRVVSTPWVDRLIKQSNFNALGNCYSWCYKGEGHSFYVLTLKDINLTLVYDIREQAWSQWTDANGNYLPIVSSFVAGFSCVVQHESNGKIYIMTGDSATDYASDIFPVDIYTPNFDGGVALRKMLSMMQFNADQTPGNVLQVRSNDYDYDPTKWTNFRSVDLGDQRPNLHNCGTFYRRALHIHHKAPYPLRIYSLDLDVALGSL